MASPPTTGFPMSSTADGSQFNPTNSSNSHSVGGLHLESEARVPWSTGLCDCTSDCKNCCITCWSPSSTFGQIAEIVSRGSTSRVSSGALYTWRSRVSGCACLDLYPYRSEMRPCGDCLVHCFCERCVLSQEYRELKNRGFNMDIGWQGNVEQRN